MTASIWITKTTTILFITHNYTMYKILFHLHFFFSWIYIMALMITELDPKEFRKCARTIGRRMTNRY